MPALARRWLRKGRPDAILRAGLVCFLISVPTLIAALLAPNARLSLALMFPAIFCLIGAGALPPLAALMPRRLAPSR